MSTAPPLVYLIPGLGADARLFKDLSLPGCEVHILEWIDPQPNETFEQYINRLTADVRWHDNPVVCGVSFGGMVAVTLGTIRPVKQVIAVSTIKTHDELPLYLRLITRLRLHLLVPMWMMRRRSGIVNWYFGVTSSISKQLLHEILKGSKPVFTRWALTQIGNWRNSAVRDNVTHIHGTADRVFPIGRIKNCVRIEGGHHFMVADRSAEVAEIMLQTIRSKQAAT